MVWLKRTKKNVLCALCCHILLAFCGRIPQYQKVKIIENRAPQSTTEHHKLIMLACLFAVTSGIIYCVFVRMSQNKTH